MLSHQIAHRELSTVVPHGAQLLVVFVNSNVACQATLLSKYSGGLGLGKSMLPARQ